MKPQVYHVDAFTSQPFRGNSAGVVFPADDLSEAQMQLIARELGHSETAFLLHSDDSDVRIRYFTPTVEVPICGHATVAAHYVRSKVSGLGNCTVWQTSLAGKHRVTIEKHNDDYRISLEQGSPGFEPPLEGETRAAIINALHLTEDDILPGLPIQVATTGHSKVMIPLKPEVDIDALSPDLAALTAISKQIGCNGFSPSRSALVKMKPMAACSHLQLALWKIRLPAMPTARWAHGWCITTCYPTMAMYCVLKAIRGAHWVVME